MRGAGWVLLGLAACGPGAADGPTVVEPVPVVVKDVSPAKAFELALIENVQRADLNAGFHRAVSPAQPSAPPPTEAMPSLVDRKSVV